MKLIWLSVTVYTISLFSPQAKALIVWIVLLLDVILIYNLHFHNYALYKQKIYRCWTYQIRPTDMHFLCCLTYLDLLDLPLISMKCPFKKQQRTSMQGAPAVKGLKGLRIEYPMKTAALLQLTLISNQYSTEIAGINKKDQWLWYLWRSIYIFKGCVASYRWAFHVHFGVIFTLALQ